MTMLRVEETICICLRVIGLRFANHCDFVSTHFWKRSSRNIRGATSGLQTILKVRAFIVRLILYLQSSGLRALVNTLSTMAIPPPPSPDGQQDQTYVVLGIVHSWDEARQMVRQSDVQRQNPWARMPKQRVGRDILAQRAIVHAERLHCSIDGSHELSHRITSASKL